MTCITWALVYIGADAVAHGILCLVDKLGNRKWVDELKVLAALEGAGYSREDVTETRLLSPAGMDKALGKIKAAMADARENFCQRNGANALPQKPVHTLHDGDGIRDNGEPYGPECKGCYVITVSSKQQPVVVDNMGNRITDPGEVYSGCYGRDHLRQKGKIAELACIAEGQQVLTNRGLVPIENVTTEMKVWDGVEWVNHGGVISKGEKEVLTYGGLEATPGHIVWAEIDGQPRTICFGDAAARCAHLIQTGAGRHPLRLGGDHQPRKEMEQSWNQRRYIEK